ncbi:aminotransferase class III-fold pyridoxal phosphate-dependent enzyme [Gemmobacter denitrificans]|uniref:Aminotransferase class III-fold pyridoxal phosphate-dependent enzyme n=1 Tax=Gemmobacter denitrificans TaxID=3123040 RepID=A0ABU8BZ55_9RHOB
MKFLATNPPRFTAEAAADIARTHFGLTGQITALYSERDQNFRIRGAGDWVLKIANEMEAPDLIDAQVAALDHLARTAPDIPLPKVRRSADGAGFRLIAGQGEACHATFAVSYLPGRIASDCALGPDDFRGIGAMIARVERGMRGFFHPALGNRALLWDIRELHHLCAKARHLGPQADEITRLLHEVMARTSGRLDHLTAQVIHGDIHGHNVIMADHDTRIAGIIDFGDMFHGPAILNLSNAMADFLHDTDQPQAMWQALIRGYAGIRRIEPEEIDLLYDLALARQLATILITATRAAENADEVDYIADAGFGAPQGLAPFLTLGRDKATAIFGAAAGLSAPVGGPSVTTLMARRKKVLGSRPYVFYDPPLHLVRGEGVWLFDAEGRRYMDLYNNVPIVGHCNPRVADAIATQTRILNTNTRYLGEQLLDYAERLGALTGGALTACAFVNSGSEANDIAWRMARAWTGQQGALTQEFAYHGITEAIDALSPSALRNATPPVHVRTILAPDGYRGPFRHGTPDLGRRYAEDADRAIRSLAQAGLKPAAVITDSAFLTNGVLDPCPGYVAELFARVRAAGGLCIADEVQSGFGRMGQHFWGYQHHGVTPDFVTIGKPAGNGHPIGVVLTRPEILDHFIEQTAFFSTFGGNNVSCAAGIAVLDEIRDRNLVARATGTGNRFKAGLKQLADQFPLVGDVRGTGLVFGLELVLDRETRAPAPVETSRLLELMRDEGALAGSEGVHGNIVKMRPPLVFDTQDCDAALAALRRSLERL